MGCICVPLAPTCRYSLDLCCKYVVIVLDCLALGLQFCKLVSGNRVDASLIGDEEARFSCIDRKVKKLSFIKTYAPYVFCTISPFSARAARIFWVVAFGTAPFRLAATSTAPKGRFICCRSCQYSAYMRLFLGHSFQILQYCIFG